MRNKTYKHTQATQGLWNGVTEQQKQHNQCATTPVHTNQIYIYNTRCNVMNSRSNAADETYACKEVHMYVCQWEGWCGCCGVKSLWGK